jgi:hypothetical protein
MMTSNKAKYGIDPGSNPGIDPSEVCSRALELVCFIGTQAASLVHKLLIVLIN